MIESKGKKEQTLKKLASTIAVWGVFFRKTVHLPRSGISRPVVTITRGLGFPHPTRPGACGRPASAVVKKFKLSEYIPQEKKILSTLHTA